MNKNGSKLRFSEFFYSFLWPCRPLIRCQIWVIFYICLDYIILSWVLTQNHSQWTILLHLIAKKFRKPSILTHFRSFLPYLLPNRPLIQCQIWVILFYLFRLHHIVMSSIINHLQWTVLLHLIAKKLRKPQFDPFSLIFALFVAL